MDSSTFNQVSESLPIPYTCIHLNHCCYTTESLPIPLPYTCIHLHHRHYNGSYSHHIETLPIPLIGINPPSFPLPLYISSFYPYPLYCIYPPTPTSTSAINLWAKVLTHHFPCPDIYSPTHTPCIYPN